ncbi:MAG: sulfite exporter TauE/SafE family protein [Fimbriimonas sp.]
MTIGQAAILFGVGALASGINSVAGGGSLISFPTLTFAMGMPTNVANATNSVALWPGSLGGALGFRNLLDKTKHHLWALFLPTLLGSGAGSILFVKTDVRIFDRIVPWLILLAAILLLLQPQVKKWALRGERTVPTSVGMVIQFFVALYGGYFGAGMGIMMLAAFAVFMEGTLHELNAVKNWLGVIINVAASAIFVFQGLVEPLPALALGTGGVVGGFAAGHFSQRVNPDRLRMVIAVYGVAMAGYYMYRTL